MKFQGQTFSVLPQPYQKQRTRQSTITQKQVQVKIPLTKQNLGVQSPMTLTIGDQTNTEMNNNPQQPENFTISSFKNNNQETTKRKSDSHKYLMINYDSNQPPASSQNNRINIIVSRKISRPASNENIAQIKPHISQNRISIQTPQSSSQETGHHKFFMNQHKYSESFIDTLNINTNPNPSHRQSSKEIKTFQEQRQLKLVAIKNIRELAQSIKEIKTLNEVSPTNIKLQHRVLQQMSQKALIPSDELEQKKKENYNKYMNIFDETLKEYQLTNFQRQMIKKNFSFGNIKYLQQIRKQVPLKQVKIKVFKPPQLTLNTIKSLQSLSMESSVSDSFQSEIDDSPDVDLLKPLSKLTGQLSLKRKISILEVPKNKEGVPLKIKEPEYLLNMKFKSRSEKERYLKNNKIFDDLLLQYQIIGNDSKVSKQFLQDLFPQSEFKKFSEIEINAFKDLIENKQVDCRKDILSAIKDAFNRLRGLTPHQVTTLELKKDTLPQSPPLSQGGKLSQNQSTGGKISPRLLKQFMLTYSKKPKINQRAIMTNQAYSTATTAFHKPSNQERKEYMLGNYIQSNIRLNSPIPYAERTIFSAGNTMPKIETSSHQKISSMDKPNSPLMFSVSKKRENFNRTQQFKIDTEVQKVSQVIEKGTYTSLIEGLYKDTTAIPFNDMKKNNLLLEHIILERENEKKKQRQIIKKKNEWLKHVFVDSKFTLKDDENTHKDQIQ